MDLTLQKNVSESFQPTVYTWRDFIVDLADQVGLGNSGLDDRRLRTATLDAYRDLCNKRDWNFLIKTWKFRLTAKANLTASYDHTGGSSERLVTVTSGTVPTSLRDYLVLIDDVPYEPDEYLTSTTFTLSLRNNPAADVASGTMTLVRVYYPCPADFKTAYHPEADNNLGGLSFIHPSELHAFLMRGTPQYGEPRGVAVVPHPKLIGQRALAVIPFTSTARVCSLMYHGRGRDLKITGMASTHVGTFTLDTGVDANRATLTGTTVSAALIGSIFRLRADTNTPENVDGEYPYDQQAVIIGVNVGSNYVLLDRDMAASYTAKAYVISDPVDVPQEAITALKAGARYYHAMAANKDRKDVQLVMGMYRDELTQLCEIDKGIIPGIGGGDADYFQDDDEMSATWFS